MLCYILLLSYTRWRNIPNSYLSLSLIHLIRKRGDLGLSKNDTEKITKDYNIFIIFTSSIKMLGFMHRQVFFKIVKFLEHMLKNLIKF